uniref:N-alpha-acetyltransferase 40 n=1 Tax=Zosterops lateralis melanops TaxID=1220523 RepID=A0A8D2PRW8_ZOSLA
AAMAAVCAKVEAANKLRDPLEAFPVFKKYDRNGLNVSIECCRVSSLDPPTLDWAFELTKANMQSLFFSRGLRDFYGGFEGFFPRGLRVLFPRFEGLFPRFGVILGCLCRSYEVQLESRVRRRGLGKFLLQILQLVANSTQMKKVMLTVFKHNHGALQFFREALQFEVDATSPSVSGCCGDDSSYEILSRSTRFGDPHSGGGPCAGCCH